MCVAVVVNHGRVRDDKGPEDSSGPNFVLDLYQRQSHLTTGGGAGSVASLKKRLLGATGSVTAAGDPARSAAALSPAPHDGRGCSDDVLEEQEGDEGEGGSEDAAGSTPGTSDHECGARDGGRGSGHAAFDDDGDGGDESAGGPAAAGTSKSKGRATRRGASSMPERSVAKRRRAVG